MAPGSCMVSLGLAFILCAGVWGCQFPAGARGEFDMPNSEGERLTISAREMVPSHKQHQLGWKMACEDQKGDLYLLAVKGGDSEEHKICVRLAVNEDGSVQISQTTPGEKDMAWLDDWVESCAAITPQHTLTVFKVAKDE